MPALVLVAGRVCVLHVFVFSLSFTLSCDFDEGEAFYSQFYYCFILKVNTSRDCPNSYCNRVLWLI